MQSQRPAQATTATLAAVVAVALIALRPHPVRLARDLSAPNDWIAAVGVDQAIATLAAALLWLLACWLGIGLLSAGCAHLPGALGRSCAAIGRAVLPRAVLRLVAGAAGLGILLTPIAAGAQQRPESSSAQSMAASAALRPPVPLGPAPAWPLTPTVPAPAWPATHAPATHAPTTHAPATHAPATHAPSTHAPSTHAPTKRTPGAPAAPGATAAPASPTAPGPTGAAQRPDTPAAPKSTPLTSPPSTSPPTTPTHKPSSRTPSPSGRPGTTPRRSPSTPDGRHGTATGQQTSTQRVRPGDSLWLLAARRLGDDVTPSQVANYWPRIYAANRSVIGDDPAQITPGQVLHLPAPTAEEKP